MNKEREKYLKDKYLEGETSLKEETELKNSLAKENQDLDPWFKYLVKEEIKTPPNLSEKLWENSSLSKKKNPLKSKILLSIVSIVLLFICGSLYNQVQKKNEYKEKKQLLEEAIKFANNGIELKEKDVFYKDDLITIYFTN